MNDHTAFRYGGRLLTSGVVALVMLGCRTVPERSALAQVTDARDDRVWTAEAAGDGLPGVSVRRVWAGTYRDFYASSISPDGRFLSMVDWSTVDLAVRDLHTGELHRLTNVQRSADKPYEDAGVSVFSRDGGKLVVGWQVAPALQLRVLDFSLDQNGVPVERKPTVIFHNPEFYPYYPFDWSPDGRQILAKVYAGTTQLALISTEDGTYQALKSFDWREPTMAEFSPDGRYVAYDFPPEVNSLNRDVFVLAVDGTQDVRIVSDPGIDRLLGWHPDGNILFHSDRGGSPGVWRIPVSNGRTEGAPELVKADVWGVEPLGFAGDDFYYGVNANPPRLYVATVDFETGRVSSAPLSVSDPAQVEARGWDWSADGEFLAISGGTPGTRGSLIIIRSADGEDEHAIHLDLRPTRRIRWDPDGESLVVWTRDSKGRRGLYRVDPETGTYSAILRADEMVRSTPRGHFALSPDGGTFYYAREKPSPGPNAPLDLVAHDLETGEVRILGDVLWPGRVSLSPDGTRLLVAVPGEPSSPQGTAVIATISIADGEVMRLHEVPPDLVFSGFEWTPDAQSVLFALTTMTPNAIEDAELWRVPAAGGEPHRIEGFEHTALRMVRVHPDGRRIAFMAGESRGEVWVMEGLGTAAASGAASTGSR